jgi:hypothetical protein
MSANKPKPQEITEKPAPDEKGEKAIEKNPIQSGEPQRGAANQDTPKVVDPSGEPKKP